MDDSTSESVDTIEPNRGRGWERVLVAVMAGTVGALAAVAVAFAAVVTRPVEVYKAGELPGEYVDAPAGERTIVLVGDIMLWDRTEELLLRHGAEYPFRATSPLVRTADLAVGNLEGPVSADSPLRAKRCAYRMPPWTLRGLSWAGFDLVGLANNHAMDCGPEGLLETLGHLDEENIGTFGAGPDLARAMEPAVVELGERTVAFCGLLAMEERLVDGRIPDEQLGRRQVAGLAGPFGATDETPGTAIGSSQQLIEMVTSASRQADMVVVFIHSGIRYHREPTPLQRKLARAAVDAGADIVVGHHAHCWQPVELYRGKPILYGLGNFAFGSGNRNADEGLLARAHVGAAGLESVELFPLYVKNRDAIVQYESKVMRGRSAQQMLRRLVALSEAPLRVERGRAVLDTTQP